MVVMGWGHPYNFLPRFSSHVNPIYKGGIGSCMCVSLNNYCDEFLGCVYVAWPNYLVVSSIGQSFDESLRISHCNASLQVYSQMSFANVILDKIPFDSDRSIYVCPTSFNLTFQWPGAFWCLSSMSSYIQIPSALLKYQVFWMTKKWMYWCTVHYYCMLQLSNLFGFMHTWIRLQTIFALKVTCSNTIAKVVPKSQGLGLVIVKILCITTTVPATLFEAS